MSNLHSLIDRLMGIALLYNAHVLKQDGHRVFLKFDTADEKHNCRQHLSDTDKKRFHPLKCRRGHGLVLCVEVIG